MFIWYPVDRSERQRLDPTSSGNQRFTPSLFIVENKTEGILHSSLYRMPFFSLGRMGLNLEYLQMDFSH